MTENEVQKMSSTISLDWGRTHIQLVISLLFYSAYPSNITSGNFLMLIFVNLYISFLYVPRMPKKHVYILFFFSGTLPNFFLEIKKNDKFKHCDVFTVQYLEFVSIFRTKTFFWPFRMYN